MIALMLVGGDGAQARPFGMSAATWSARPTIASDAATAPRSRPRPSQDKARTRWRVRPGDPGLQAVQAAARNAAQARERSARCRRSWCRTGWRRAGSRWRRVRQRVAVVAGRDLPTQSASGGQTNVTVNQTAPQAILNWQTFNVGSQTTVNFNQQASTWTALNRVIGNLGPSQILGHINAPSVRCW
jgi:hypothetical protein